MNANIGREVKTPFNQDDKKLVLLNVIFRSIDYSISNFDIF